MCNQERKKEVLFNVAQQLQILLNSYIYINREYSVGCSVGHSCALRSSVTVPEFKNAAR